MKIHPGKCRFAVQEIIYLAHRINSFGIKIDDSKYQAIETYPVPKNVKNVRAFLGMAQFYRRYIKSFATIALPLNKLLRKDTKFVWTEECQVAFETLKRALVTAPVLAFPQFDKPFILAVDASDEYIGYVLSQLDSGNRHFYPQADTLCVHLTLTLWVQCIVHLRSLFLIFTKQTYTQICCFICFSAL